MDPGPPYRPSRLPAAAHRRAVWGQFRRLAHTLFAVWRITREDCAPPSLDAHLWAFAGFHQQPWNARYRSRPWQKVAFHLVRRSQVSGMAVSEFTWMLHVAMEIEAPVKDYSRQTGEGFRRLVPSLSRFMGMTRAQAAYADAHGKDWCGSAWCAEERRHATTFARLISRLTGLAAIPDNANDVGPVTPTEAGALGLLAGRQSSEWSAASVYIMLGAHSTADLHEALRNVERDEIKHLAILSALDRYLRGPRPAGRLLDLIREALKQYRGHQRRRTAGEAMGANPASALEVIVAHLLSERRIRAWLADLPVRVLDAVFETPSQAPDLPSVPSSPDQDRQDREDARRARETRISLAHWRALARARAVQQRAWEEKHAATIDQLVIGEFDGFSTAGLPESPEDRRIRRRIRRRASGRLRAAVLGRLRLHQVVHNRHVAGLCQNSSARPA